MFNVKTDTIRERTTNGPTYMKGRQYYKHGHVKHIAYDQNNGLIVAQVEGTRMYHVRIILNSQGELHDATCTCSAFSAYWGYCRHIAAALLHCIDVFSQEHKLPGNNQKKTGRQERRHDNSESQHTTLPDRERNGQEKDKAQMLRRNRSKAKDFLSRMQHVCQLQAATNKQIISLRVVLFCPRSTSGTPWFSMAAGFGKKLFPITNIEQFAEAISRDLPVELDQSFIYNPALHTFHDNDGPLISMIQDAFENDYKAVFGTAGSASRDRCFPLNPSRLASFLIFSGQLNDCTWLSHLDEPRVPVEVKQAGLPIRLRLETSSQDNNSDLPPFQLSLVSEQPIHQITSSRNVYLAGDVFHLPPADHVRFIEPLLAAFTKPNVKALYLSHEEAGLLLSEIKPALEAFCPIEIAAEVAKLIVDVPLQADIELDYLSASGLKAAIQFQYDSHTINPLQAKPAAQDETDTTLIIRDKDKEDNLIQMFQEAGFSQYGSSLRLNDHDRLFDFIASDLNGLAQHAEVKLSPEAEKIKILPPPALKFQLSKHAVQDDLVFQQQYGHLQPAEWPVYIKAVKDNKTYYRRSDGSFQMVDLSHRSLLTDIDHLMALWQVKPSAKTQSLPAYRALTLSRFCEQYADNSHLHISSSLREQITNMNQPGALRFRTPQILADKLRPYQKTGYRWLCMLDHYGLGGILADDMGLGKTLQTIAFIHYIWHKYKRNTIIIAPTSLIYNWAAEFEKFAPLLPVGIIDGHPEKRTEILKNRKRYACLITSYSLLRRDIDEIKAFSFGCCFIDEAQNIKNPETQNARSVKQIQADRCFALTGTPIENTLTELWSIFDFILPGYLFSHHHFQKHYELPISRENDHEKAENLRMLISPFLLRRMKKNVLQELPEKIETRTICDMTTQQRLMYEAFLEKSKSDLSRELQQAGFAKSQIYILALLTRLRQICCHPGLFDKHYEGGSGKLLLLDELLADSFASGHRVLLFSQFTQMLDIIRKRVEANGEKPLYIDGQVPADERVRLVDRFNEGDGRLFLISLRAGGTGLNLTGADTVIHYDPWWNPAVEDQATDRAYRIGQENVVQVIKLFTRNSVEEKIYRLQEQKQRLADTMIKPGQNLLSKMDVQEVLQLFDINHSVK